MIKNDFSDLHPPQSELNGIYRGVVEDNIDPLKAGRCRVRVFGVHTAVKEQTTTTGVPTDNLPWAEPALSLIEGAISNYGVWGVPLQGAHVFLFFENGNILNPRFFASAPGIPTTAPDTTLGFNDPDGVYPDKLDDPDFYSPEGSEYNECISLATHGGHRIEIDNTPGNKRILIVHQCGATIGISNSGDISISAFNNLEESGALSDFQLNVQHDMNTVVLENSGETVKGPIGKTLNVSEGAYNITVKKGNCNLIVSEGNCDISAPGGEVNITTPLFTTSERTELSGTSSSTSNDIVRGVFLDTYNNHTHTYDGGITYGPSPKSTGGDKTINTTAG